MSNGVGPPHRVAAALLAASLLVGACAGGSPSRPTAARLDASITVASFNFGESALLGELYARALEGAGYPVERQLRLGAREVVQPALLQGRVDLVPEYLGSALAFLVPDAPRVGDPLAARKALQDVYRGHDITVLDPAPGENRNGFVVRRETADELGLRSLSDLVPVAAQLTFGGPPECPERPLCLAGLEQVYGLEFEAVEVLDSGGPLTLAALSADRVDVALLFSTNGALAGDDLRLLEDDRGLQPAENVVPVLRSAIVARHGAGVVEVIDRVTERLDEPTLVGLNRRLDRGERLHDVAAGWLASQGIA